MTNFKPTREAPNQLLVEGTDDKYTVINLIQKSGVEWTGENKSIPFIPELGQEDGGLETLFKQLEVQSKRLQTIEEGNLGVVIDANSNPKSRWARIREIIDKSGMGVSLPDEPKAAGEVLQLPSKKRRFGVWMMPDNRSEGCLEHFLMKLIPSKDLLWPDAQMIVREVGNKGAPFWEKKNSNMMAKAEIHTWLAWQEVPGAPFGKSIKYGSLDGTNQAAKDFLAWFKRLFLE